MRPVLPLRLWLSLSHLVVFVLPIAVLVGTGALARDLRNQTEWDLRHQGALLSLHIEERLGEGEGRLADLQLSPFLQRIKGETLAGIQVVDAAGVVIATSGDVLGEDLSDDPGVAAALRGSEGTLVLPRLGGRRHALGSESRNSRVRVFVARPVMMDGEVLGAIRLSRTPREELQALYQMAPRLLWGTLFGLLATVGLALIAAWIPTVSLRKVARGSHQIASGRFDGMADLDRPARSQVQEVQATAVAVRTMAKRLQERIRYISEFAANVSHEFKTPLSTLRGTLELLGDEDGMDEAQRTRFLHNAEAEVERLERLVSGLLSLARAEEGGSERVDLDALGARVASGREVALEGRAGEVWGDRAQLETVVANLLDNALQHGGGGVRLRAWQEEERAGFEVIDGGPGISPGNLPRVFERFFTTRRTEGGTGLGLALVKVICERHGGGVEVDSQPGRTCFRVWWRRCG